MPDTVTLDMNELASQVAGSIKADVIASLLNDPIVAKHGVVTPDGGVADKEVKKERARCAKVCRNLNNEFGWGAASMCAEAIEKGEK